VAHHLHAARWHTDDEDGEEEDEEEDGEEDGEEGTR